MRVFAQRACQLEIDGGRFHILAVMMIEEGDSEYPVMQVQDITSQKVVYLEMREDFLAGLDDYGSGKLQYKLVPPEVSLK